MTLVNLLDHGYIQLIETWGSDEHIVESARMSTQKGFQGWGEPGAPGDEKLLKYLADNHHDTPFEFAGATFQVRAPIFVFREWHRHRTFSYNEASARYAPLAAEDYRPTIERLWRVDKKNRQAQGTGKPLEWEDAQVWLKGLDTLQADAQHMYDVGLRIGIPKELARLALTVARYSTMRAQANLRNLLGFLRLRNAPNAQEEIRVYAAAMSDILKEIFPRTFEAFGL